MGRGEVLGFLSYVLYVDCRKMAGYSVEREEVITRGYNEVENVEGVLQLPMDFFLYHLFGAEEER